MITILIISMYIERSVFIHNYIIWDTSIRTPNLLHLLLSLVVHAKMVCSVSWTFLRTTNSCNKSFLLFLSSIIQNVIYFHCIFQISLFLSVSMINSEIFLNEMCVISYIINMSWNRVHAVKHRWQVNENNIVQNCVMWHILNNAARREH